MEDIDKLLADLSWEKPKDVSATAINKLVKIDDEQVTLLLQPGNQSCWENAARVLERIGYPRNQSALPGLLDWLRDMDSPGAETAKKILFEIDRMILVHLIEDAARQASLADDFIWMAGLRDIVLEAGVEEFLNPRISQILNFEKLFMSDMQF